MTRIREVRAASDEAGLPCEYLRNQATLLRRLVIGGNVHGRLSALEALL